MITLNKMFSINGKLERLEFLWITLIYFSLAYIVYNFLFGYLLKSVHSHDDAIAKGIFYFSLTWALCYIKLLSVAKRLTDIGARYPVTAFIITFFLIAPVLSTYCIYTNVIDTTKINNTLFINDMIFITLYICLAGILVFMPSSKVKDV